MHRHLIALFALALLGSPGCGKGDKADKGDKGKATAAARTDPKASDKDKPKPKATTNADKGNGKSTASAAKTSSKPATAAKPAPAEAKPPVPALPEVIAYADTEVALAQLIRDVAAAIVDRREADAARLVYTLRLPDHETWFRDHFPKKRVARLIEDYEKQRDDLGNLALAIRDARKRGLSEIKVTRLAAAGDAQAVGYQDAALQKLATGEHPTALYSVRLQSPDGARTFHVWSFVHDGGTFRFVGKMKAAGSEHRTPSGRDVNEFTHADAERILAVEKPGDPAR